MEELYWYITLFCISFLNEILIARKEQLIPKHLTIQTLSPLHLVSVASLHTHHVDSLVGTRFHHTCTCISNPNVKKFEYENTAYHKDLGSYSNRIKGPDHRRGKFWNTHIVKMHGFVFITWPNIKASYIVTLNKDMFQKLNRQILYDCNPHMWHVWCITHFVSKM